MPRASRASVLEILDLLFDDNQELDLEVQRGVWVFCRLKPSLLEAGFFQFSSIVHYRILALVDNEDLKPLETLRSARSNSVAMALFYMACGEDKDRIPYRYTKRERGPIWKNNTPTNAGIKNLAPSVWSAAPQPRPDIAELTQLCKDIKKRAGQQADDEGKDEDAEQASEAAAATAAAAGDDEEMDVDKEMEVEDEDEDEEDDEERPPGGQLGTEQKGMDYDGEYWSHVPPDYVDDETHFPQPDSQEQQYDSPQSQQTHASSQNPLQKDVQKLASDVHEAKLISVPFRQLFPGMNVTELHPALQTSREAIKHLDRDDWTRDEVYSPPADTQTRNISNSQDPLLDGLQHLASSLEAELRIAGPFRKAFPNLSVKEVREDLSFNYEIAATRIAFPFVESFPQRTPAQVKKELEKYKQMASPIVAMFNIASPLDNVDEAIEAAEVLEDLVVKKGLNFADVKQQLDNANLIATAFGSKSVVEVEKELADVKRQLEIANLIATPFITAFGSKSVADIKEQLDNANRIATPFITAFDGRPVVEVEKELADVKQQLDNANRIATPFTTAFGSKSVAVKEELDTANRVVTPLITAFRSKSVADVKEELDTASKSVVNFNEELAGANKQLTDVIEALQSTTILGPDAIEDAPHCVRKLIQGLAVAHDQLRTNKSSFDRQNHETMLSVLQAINAESLTGDNLGATVKHAFGVLRHAHQQDKTGRTTAEQSLAAVRRALGTRQHDLVKFIEAKNQSMTQMGLGLTQIGSSFNINIGGDTESLSRQIDIRCLKLLRPLRTMFGYSETNPDHDCELYSKIDKLHQRERRGQELLSNLRRYLGYTPSILSNHTPPPVSFQDSCAEMENSIRALVDMVATAAEHLQCEVEELLVHVKELSAKATNSSAIVEAIRVAANIWPQPQDREDEEDIERLRQFAANGRAALDERQALSTAAGRISRLCAAHGCNEHQLEETTTELITTIRRIQDTLGSSDDLATVAVQATTKLKSLANLEAKLGTAGAKQTLHRLGTLLKLEEDVQEQVAGL